MSGYHVLLNLPWDKNPTDIGGALELGGQVLAILIVGFVVIRLAHLFVGGIARALLTRENLEGTAEELSAAELKKRQSTIEDLGVNVIRFFVSLSPV
jgi:hypothetical protein